MIDDVFPGPLCRILELAKQGITAIVGSGGKTSLLYLLAKEIIEAKEKAVVTTTTHLLPPEAKRDVDLWILGEDLPDLGELEDRMSKGKCVLLVKGHTLDGKLRGLSDKQMARLNQLENTRILVEADGAQRRALKAWAEWEPNLPENINHLITMVGASGLGRNLAPDWVHRPEIFAKASGLLPGQRVSPKALAKVLLGPYGPLKSRPLGCSASLVVNQADACGTTLLKEFKQAILDEQSQNYCFDRILEGRLRWGRLSRL